MKRGEISVALPVYNGANYIREALDSILAQDFSDFELVISDNCSTDETPVILAEYAKRDSRIVVSKSETFLPQADNANRVVDLCSGTWVKLFCHDDIMKPQCLSSLLREINKANDDSVGLVGNGESLLFSNGYNYNRVSDAGPRESFCDGRDFIKKVLSGTAEFGLPSLTTAMVRKQAWVESYKFDKRFAHFDVFFWTRLLMKWNYIYIPQILTTNRIHGEQVAVSARKSLRSVQDHRLFYREFLDEFGEALKLDRSTRIKTHMKGVSFAGSTVAIEIMKGRPFRAISVFTKMPLPWWPLLPIFVVRSLTQEKKKIAPIVDHVPPSLMYPG